MLQSRERKLPTNSQVVKYNTAGDGNCFFHAVFGDNSSGPYKAERAQDMRMEWHKFLSQFTSLDDVSMPAPLRAQLEKVFDAFLDTPRDLTGKSGKVKGLAEQTNKKIEEAVSKTQELKEEIVKNFRDDGDFRKGIYDIILKSINERNKRCPEDLKPTPSVQELLDDEKKLYNEVTAELKSCALELKPNLTEEEYASTYDSKVIKDSFFNDEVLYKAYLEAIESKSYFPFIEEVQILASLANIEINVHCEFSGREEQQKFEPDPQMINNDDQLNQVFNRESYKLNDELWGSKERETIYLGGNHYSRAKIVTKEIQEQEDFQLAKQLQVDEILEYCTISKDSPARKEVEGRFDELLAKNANGKIDIVVRQCVSDVEQRMKRSEEQNSLSLPRCSMEEPRIEPYQQQIQPLVKSIFIALYIFI